MNNYVVYKHTSPSGKSYIGITNNYEKRCDDHQRRYSQCIAFLTAINKYGWDNFTHEILRENLTLEDANFLEGFYIKEYNSISPNGYNLKTGGDVVKFSDEIRKKQSESQKGIKNHRFGKKESDEVRKKKSDKLKGIPKSEETKKRMSTAQKGRVVTESEKEKRRRSMEGKYLGENNKKSIIFRVTSPDGKYFMIKGLNDFCLKNNLCRANMLAVANGKRDSSNGWKCEHIDEEKKKQALENIKNREQKRFDFYESRGKKVKIFSPEGHIFIVQSMNKFCKEHGLNSGHMSAIARGVKKQYKGWRCECCND